jgi:signal transduction histidine kinase
MDVKGRTDPSAGLYELLLELAYGLSGSLDIGEVLKEALAATRRLVDFRGGSIALIENDALSIAVSEPAVGPEVAALRLPVGKGLSGRVAETGHSIYSKDLQHDERVDMNVRTLDTNRAIRSYFAVPVVASGEIVGVLQVDSEEVDAFSDEQRAMVSSLAPLIGSAIQNARVFTAELETHERIRELERLRSDFIAITSHELRTPLTPLVGFAELLHMGRAEAIAAFPSVDISERMLASVERLRALVDELQRLAAVETDQLQLREDLIDLISIIEETTAPFIHARPIRLHLEGAMYALGDAARFSDALRCLLDNAVNFSPEGTPIEITSSLHDGRVRIDVVDGGGGVPAQDAETIFDRFTQRGSPHTREVGGLGIGLPVARGLIERMGGTLDVVPGDRGHFVIVLPSGGSDH